MCRTACTLFCLNVVAMAAVAAEQGEEAQQLAILERIAPSLVTVEYTLRYDDGDSPPGTVLRYLDSSWSLYQLSRQSASAVEQRRPLEVPGLLISPHQIISRDPTIPDRFIASIRVRQGDHAAPARRVGYALERNAVYLEVADPLENSVPLEFDVDAERPYHAIIHAELGGMWRMAAKPLAVSVLIGELGRRSIAVPPYSLIVDGKGTPVGLAMADELPVDDSWKGSPSGWPQLTDQEHRDMLDRFEAVAERGLVRVQLNFRSPRDQDEPGGFGRGGRGRGGFGRGIGRGRGAAGRSDENETERQVVGVLVDPHHVLILTELKSAVTARLERIRVYGPAGESTEAKFVASLRDYGALIAELAQPVDGAFELSRQSVYELEQRLLVNAEVNIQGEERTAEVYHDRIVSFGLGWRRHVYPTAANAREDSFLFDRDGNLVALPVIQRLSLSAAQRAGRSVSRTTSAGYLAEVLDDLDEHLDRYNVPLSEDDTNRVAWLGVVLQPLDRDLARANRVADQTRDGRIGGLITYVYIDSPAADAGIEPGAILLRLHVEDQVRPLDVRVVESALGSVPFPWDRLDEIPEQVFDRLPKPWPSVENNFTRMLTDLGFGTRFTAEFIVDGELRREDFVVTPSPPHFEAAPQHQANEFGITVRDVTYEVRRQLQIGGEEAGVIVSKIEAGSKASVAGIRPYEIITHINGRAVPDVKLFEAYTAPDSGQLELSVKRMTRSRQVRLK